MQINVLFFAAARERAGTDEQSLTLADGATVSQALSAIVSAYPAVEPLLPYLRVAVDEVFESDLSRVLRPGAELALIPPVSGGAP